MTSLLTQNLATHKDILRQRTEEVDALNNRLQEYSATQKAELERVQALQTRVKRRDERQARIRNLKRAIAERKTPQPLAVKPVLGSADAEILKPDIVAVLGQPDGQLPVQLVKSVRAAFQANNAALERRADELHGRSSELETLYRRIVSLCTGVAEDKVEEALPSLVAAVESEKAAANDGEEHDLSRVRDFLKRVDKGSARMVAAIEA